jgi:hypothetical protein
MDCIESSPFPPVFKLDRTVAPAGPRGMATVRTCARALAGMQKEAIVEYGATGAVWRLVCDEGPWLNGTDLAPFPLAFFSAGLTASYLAELLQHARRRGILLQAVELTVDNHYGMEGSASAGTMKGSALPVQATFAIDADATPVERQALAIDAVASSPADAALRTALSSRFSLTLNGAAVDPRPLQAAIQAPPGDPFACFGTARPARAASFVTGIVRKTGEPEPGTVSGSGVPVGLQGEQKRTVHVRATGTLRADGLKAIRVRCIRPAGSEFEFLSDDSAACGGAERAPPGPVLLSAGIAFCYMTQLGRYARIVGQPLHAYRIVQDTALSLPGAAPAAARPPCAEPIETHVYLDSDAGPDESRTLIRMGEQTCYLHAAFRGANKTRVRLR